VKPKLPRVRTAPRKSGPHRTRKNEPARKAKHKDWLRNVSAAEGDH
jgi:hypothetical protein